MANILLKDFFLFFSEKIAATYREPKGKRNWSFRMTFRCLKRVRAISAKICTFDVDTGGSVSAIVGHFFWKKNLCVGHFHRDESF